MQWFSFDDPGGELGGILELEPVDGRGLALELHVHLRDGVTLLAWLTERGDVLVSGVAGEA